MSQLNDPSFQGALTETAAKIHFEKQTYYEDTKSHVCKQKFMTISSTIYTLKDFYLTSELNSKIEIFIAAGLIDYWHEKSLDKMHISSNGQKRPNVIKMSHLSGCFQLWLIGMVFSLIVVSIEIISKSKLLLAKTCFKKFQRI